MSLFKRSKSKGNEKDKKSLAAGNKSFWVKNAAKSFASMAPEAFKAAMPNLEESMVGLRKDALEGGSLNTTFRSIKQTMIFVKKKAWDDVVKVGLSNTMADLKSGNLNNMKRENKMTDELTGFDPNEFSDLEDFGGFGEGDDEFADLEGSSGSDGGNTTINHNGDNSSDAIASESENENTRFIGNQKMSTVMSMLNTQNVLIGLNTIQKTQAEILRFNTEQVSNFHAASLDYYDTTTKSLSAIGQTLDKMHDLIQIGNDYNGASNFDEKNKIKNRRNSGGKVGIVEKLKGWAEQNFGDDANMDMFGMVKTMAANPIGNLLKSTGMLKGILPKQLLKFLGKMDTSISGFKGGLEQKHQGMESGNMLQRLVYDLFLKNKDRKSASLIQSKDELSVTKQAVPFDDQTRHSIVETIPELLARILNVNENIYEVIPSMTDRDGKPTGALRHRSSKEIKTGNILTTNFKTGVLQGRKSLEDEFQLDLDSLSSYEISGTRFIIRCKSALRATKNISFNEIESYLSRLSLTMARSEDPLPNTKDYDEIALQLGINLFPSKVQKIIVNEYVSLSQGEMIELTNAVNSANSMIGSEVEKILRNSPIVARSFSAKNLKNVQSFETAIKNAETAKNEHFSNLANGIDKDNFDKNYAQDTTDNEGNVSNKGNKFVKNWITDNRDKYDLDDDDDEKLDSRAFELFRNDKKNGLAKYLASEDKETGYDDYIKDKNENLSIYKKASSINPFLEVKDTNEFQSTVEKEKLTNKDFGDISNEAYRKNKLNKTGNIKGDGLLSKIANKTLDMTDRLTSSSKMQGGNLNSLRSNDEVSASYVKNTLGRAISLIRNSKMLTEDNSSEFSSIESAYDTLINGDTFKKEGILKFEREGFPPNYKEYQRIVESVKDFAREIPGAKGKEIFKTLGEKAVNLANNLKDKLTDKIKGTSHKKGGMIRQSASVKDSPIKPGDGDNIVISAKTNEAVLNEGGVKILGGETGVNYINELGESIKEGAKKILEKGSTLMNSGKQSIKTKTKKLSEDEAIQRGFSHIRDGLFKMKDVLKKNNVDIDEIVEDIADKVTGTVNKAKNSEAVKTAKGKIISASKTGIGRFLNFKKNLINNFKMKIDDFSHDLLQAAGIENGDLNTAKMLIKASATYLEGGFEAVEKMDVLSTIKALFIPGSSIVTHLDSIKDTKMGDALIKIAKLEFNLDGAKKLAKMGVGALASGAKAGIGKLGRGIKKLFSDKDKEDDGKDDDNKDDDNKDNKDDDNKDDDNKDNKDDDNKDDKDKKKEEAKEEKKKAKEEVNEKKKSLRQKYLEGKRKVKKAIDPNYEVPESTNPLQKGWKGIKALGRGVKGAAKGVGGAVKGAGRGIKGAAKGVGALGRGIRGVGKVAKFVTKPGVAMLKGAGSLASKALGGASTLAGGLSGGLGSLATGLGGAASSLGGAAASAATAAAPFILPALAIGGAAYGAYKFIDKVNKDEKYAELVWRSKTGDKTVNQAISNLDPDEQKEYSEFVKKKGNDITNFEKTPSGKVTVTWKRGSSGGALGTANSVVDFITAGALSAGLDSKDFQQVADMADTHEGTIGNAEMAIINMWGQEKKDRFLKWWESGRQSEFTKNAKKALKWGLRFSTLGLSLIGEALYNDLDKEEFNLVARLMYSGDSKLGTQKMASWDEDKYNSFKDYYKTWMEKEVKGEEKDKGWLANVSDFFFGSDDDEKAKDEKSSKQQSSENAARSVSDITSKKSGGFVDRKAVKFASGGSVEKNAKAPSYIDSVPAILNKEEFVLNSNATSKLTKTHGSKFLDNLNSNGAIPDTSNITNELLSEIIKLLRSIDVHSGTVSKELGSLIQVVSSNDTTNDTRRISKGGSGNAFNGGTRITPSYTNENLLNTSRARISAITKY